MARYEARKLLLFDIDGTLLTSNGVSRRLMDEALAGLFGPHVSSRGVAFSGRTDLDIMAEILQTPGIPTEDLPRFVPLALEAYARRARGRIHSANVSVLPKVRHLLERLHGDRTVQLGLVTGNLHSTAYFKLEAVDLALKFPFGAFGSDHADRNLLPALAVKRAREYNGVSYTGHDIVVIGDSVHDIRCGHHTGAYCVAVATGLTSTDRLAAEKPHLLLEDLSDTEAFCTAVLSEPRLPGQGMGARL